MNTETTLPYHWLKSISKSLKAHDELPLWGSPPVFPLVSLEDFLSKALSLKNLKITQTGVNWETSADHLKGLGGNPFILPFTVSPLKGKGYLLLPAQDIKKLFSLSIGANGANLDLFLEDFIQFIEIELTQGFQKTKYDAGLTLQWEESLSELEDGVYLAVDYALQVEKDTFSCRLLFDQELRKSIKERYSLKPLSYPKGMGESAYVTLQMIAGHTTLTRKDWNLLQPGDFLVLDNLLLQPKDEAKEEKGRIVILLDDIPLYRGKIKDGNIKLLEYPVLQEVHNNMAKLPDEDFDEEDSFDIDEDFEEEEGDEELEEEDLENEELDEEQEEETLQKPVEKKSAASSVSSGTPTPTTKIDEIPLNVSVEVGRIQISIQKLMELQPGNLLELDVRPEDGVDLVVNGRCIAKGELLKIGDLLGVRILDKA